MREGHEVKVLQVLFHYLAQACLTKQWRQVWRRSHVCPSVTQYHHRKICSHDKLSGFHDGYFAYDSLFGFDTVYIGRLRKTFRKNLLSPSSRLERLRTGGSLRWLEDMLLIVLFFLLIVLFCCVVLVVNCVVLRTVCKCVLYYCHRVSTQLQLNISYHIISYMSQLGGLPMGRAKGKLWNGGQNTGGPSRFEMSLR
jgi:hypothetical protein